VDRIAVGLGMIPRGEVGLIFAGMGLDIVFGGKPVLGNGEFAAVVAMVMITTLVTPPLLRWRLSRADAISPVAPGARAG
jgi:Kef-type K+ transport system membrane component KefB